MAKAPKQVNYDELVTKPLTTHKLASTVAILEGGKSQAAIGNIREILGALVKIEVECTKRGQPCVEGWLMSAVAKKVK